MKTEGSYEDPSWIRRILFQKRRLLGKLGARAAWQVRDGFYENADYTRRIQLEKESPVDKVGGPAAFRVGIEQLAVRTRTEAR